MNENDSLPEREDFTADVEKSRRLQRRLRAQVKGGILVTVIILGGLASLLFYDSRHQLILERLRQDLRFGALALGGKLHEYRSIAQQITSRTVIRNLLESYNRGDLELAELRADTAPKLADAMRLSASIVGIRRFDARGRLVVEVGEKPTGPAPRLTGPVTRLGIPQISPEGGRLVLIASIYARDGSPVGTDLVSFDVSEAVEMVERLRQQFEYPVQIAFLAEGAPPFHLEADAGNSDSDRLPADRLERIVGESSGSGLHEFTVDGHYLVSLPIPNGDWRMIFVAETDAIMRDLRHDSRYLFAAILLLTLVGIPVTNILVKPTVGRILIGEQRLEGLYHRNQQLLEETLKNSRLLDEVLNSMPSVIFVKDREGRYQLVNQAYCDERQLTREQIIGKTDFDLHSPETAEAVRKNDLLAIEKGSAMVLEEQLVVNGETRTFLTTKLPLRDQDDRIYATCGLATDVTDIKKTEELRFALEKAEAANYAKTAFLANMSHELRTPLHGILSYADLGSKRSKSLEREKLGRYFDNIQQSGRRLLDLLNDLLDLSKLEAGKYELVYRKVAPGQVLDECLVELEPMINARRLDVEMPADALDYIFEGDLEKFRQVMRNLLGNAIKFSPPGGRIDIEFDDCHLQVGDLHVAGFEVRLIDDGEGIAAGELDKVFDKFFQSGKPHAGGTGLGLSICREIVLLHHGEIRAENCAGRGARFVVRLPRKNPFAAISEMRVV